MRYAAFNFCFHIQLAPLQHGRRRRSLRRRCFAFGRAWQLVPRLSQLERVHRYTIGKQSSPAPARVHRYTMDKQSGLGAPVHYEQTVRPGCTGTLWSNSQARVHWYTICGQTVRPGCTGTLRANSQAQVHRCAMSKQSGLGASAHYEQTVRPGCTGTLGADSQARVHRYTMSKQSGLGAPVHYEQTVRPGCTGTL